MCWFLFRLTIYRYFRIFMPRKRIRGLLFANTSKFVLSVFRTKQKVHFLSVPSLVIPFEQGGYFFFRLKKLFTVLSGSPYQDPVPSPWAVRDCSIMQSCEIFIVSQSYVCVLKPQLRVDVKIIPSKRNRIMTTTNAKPCEHVLSSAY